MSNSRPLARLLDAQARAADPADHAWVAASAGTGKTQVLVARVLRLLLAGVPASAILCITFTKLAAAEMQERVLGRLSLWARADEAELASELAALDEPADEAGRARARRLFAQLLDSPQGLAVQTIHAFSQSLIASFPVEAGVAPGFQTLDDRAGLALRRDLLRSAIEAADANDGTGGDAEFLADIALLSRQGGERRLTALLASLGRHAEALAGLRGVALEPMLRRGFGMRTDSDAVADLANGVAQHALVAGTACLLRSWSRVQKPSAQAAAQRAAAWLANPGDIAKLSALYLTSGKARKDGAVLKEQEAAEPGLKAKFAAMANAVLDIDERQRLHTAVDRAALHLRVARRLAADWIVAKARAGVIDYDDMISAARRLLTAPGAADWVRYKLDARIDHLLVDEAQDTNEAQWTIVDALVAEFFAGTGARAPGRRLFVVGDYKQAIFGFQGSDPRVYRDQREHFEQLAGDAGAPLTVVPLDTNFRSVAAVLDVVDAVARALPADALDPDGVPPHLPHRSPSAGAVVLLPPTGENVDYAGEQDDVEEDGARPGQREIDHAQALARTIARWLDPVDPLRLPHNGLPVAPQDIMVLVRRRTAFSGALVAALHSHGVPVAGVDRLKLAEPLAVADMLALIRFVLLPEDDLTLACLCVSPFLGLSHDALHAVAFGRPGAGSPGSLWSAMRASADPAVVAARGWLEACLGFADYAAPYEFLERVLSGPLQGRARLLARLGGEAHDAIDTMLDQALAFEQLEAPSLQGFLAWVEGEDIEIKRDPDAPHGDVRLMTVHGAKGLQAPLVILADTTHGLRAGDSGLLMDFDGRRLPIEPGTSKGFSGPLGAAFEAKATEALHEHWRLLYVALTRAETLLFVAGALPKKGVAENSWYAQVETAMAALGASSEADRFHGTDVFAWRQGTPMANSDVALVPDASRLLMPDWLDAQTPEEARPPRPLSPSALTPDTLATPPAGPAAVEAARRGAALHALFERLPNVPASRRRAMGEAWAAALPSRTDAAALVDTVLAVLDDPAFASVFAADALAEAPVAARLGETIIAGQVDRLLVTPEQVTIIDFKTGRRVPANAADVPVQHVAQMAGYVAALGAVFPGRRIEATLLYTSGPRMIVLPPALLVAHAAPTLVPFVKDALNLPVSGPILKLG